MSNVHQNFKNVFSYAAGVEKWCRDSFESWGGSPLQYTFCNDFAIADWYGAKNVRETYNRIKKNWLSDYKAFTEVAISLNLLSWANDQMRNQGIDGRDELIELYSDLYYKARDDFYDRYNGNKEATDYFFEMTD